MKRKILFKAKRVENNEWVEGDLRRMVIGGNLRYFIQELDDKPLRVARSTISQFTGLKDKNGNKIFEGDELKRQNGKTDIVIYEDGLLLIKNENGDTDFIAKNNGFEIKGSIHDNK